jgi:hypothetical protein
MLPVMKLLLDSFWRALAYMLMPRVIGLSLLPLLLSGGAALALGWFFWEDAVSSVHATLQSWSLTEALFKWLEGTVGAGFRSVMAPLIVVALALPAVVVLTLLMVAAFMTPALIGLVAERRFPWLERRQGGSLWLSVLKSLGYTAVALVALLVTSPLWLVPPLVLILPPLIWGWLSTQVMSDEVLAEHASRAELRAVLQQHRWPLLLIGVVSGYLGAAPSLIWAFSAATLIFAPLLVAVSVWLYILVFAFSALWFVHYGLAALQAHRTAVEGEVMPAAPSRRGVAATGLGTVEDINTRAP